MMDFCVLSFLSQQTEFTELQRDDEEEKVTFSFGSSAACQQGAAKNQTLKPAKTKSMPNQTL